MPSGLCHSLSCYFFTRTASLTRFTRVTRFTRITELARISKLARFTRITGTKEYGLIFVEIVKHPYGDGEDRDEDGEDCQDCQDGEDCVKNVYRL